MEDINNYIKENDTDNVILNKLKELGTKLTGQENVQGETVADVLDFINTNYSGGGSGSNTVLYLKVTEISSTMYAYKDEDCTIKADMNELYNACKKGCIFSIAGFYEALPCGYGKSVNSETGKEEFTTVTIVYGNTSMIIYSSEFMA